jgi:excinuclease ABC subunit B
VRKISGATKPSKANEAAFHRAVENPNVPGRRRRGARADAEGLSREELEKLAITLEEEMFVAAEELRFEYAAKLRDEIKDLRRELLALAEPVG